MLNALARYSKHIVSVVSGEAFRHVPKPAVLFKFSSEKDLGKWHVFTDSYFGGRSAAAFQLAESKEAAVFSGHCTLDQEEDADIKRAGYCSASSKVTSWGDYYSLERYSHLVYSVRGDGRTYIANLRTDSIADGAGDLWQAAFKTRPGEWLDVHIPFSSFMLTVGGQCAAHRFLLPKDRVISVGVAVSALDEAPPAAFDIITRKADSDSSSNSSSGGSSSSTASSSSQHSSSSTAVGSSVQGAAGSGNSTRMEAAAGGAPATAAAVSSSAAASGSSDSQQHSYGFDFRLELREVRAEQSVDAASEMY